MQTILLILIILTGVIFAATVMLMNPKGGGLGAIGGMTMGGSNEYGSKKSLQTTLKKAAIITGVVFVVSCFIYPYL